MNVHYKTLDWALQGLDEGNLNKAEFDICLYCARKVDFETMVVKSYSAAQVCRFYGLDATEANRKVYTRALKSLESATSNAVSDDYYHCQPGMERTFNVTLPRQNPWEAAESRVSLCRGMSQRECPNGNVPTDEPVIVTKAESYDGNASSGSQRECPNGNDVCMSITNQCGSTEPVSPEREPLNPQGGLLPLPSPQGDRSNAAGLSKSKPFTEGNDKTKSNPLSPQQCDDLNLIVSRFRVIWNRYHNGFDPDESDTHKLLRWYSPLEVLCAFRHMLVKATRTTNTMCARFFASAAANNAEENRRSDTPLLFESYTETENAELQEILMLDKSWRKLFCIDAPNPKIDTILQEKAIQAAARKTKKLLDEVRKAGIIIGQQSAAAIGAEWNGDPRFHVDVNPDLTFEYGGKQGRVEIGENGKLKVKHVIQESPVLHEVVAKA